MAVELKSHKKQALSHQEKLDLMIEYMNETGKKITNTTQYKGYNIGNMKANLRQQYHNGTLNMDKKLLDAFIENGIIVKEKERIRTSQQEKYEFLMSLNGKNKEELSKAKMESGLTYVYIKNQMKRDYNGGTLKLTPEEIRNLRINGHLDYSKKEKEEIAKRYNLPAKYAVDIEREVGSYEEFIKQYKEGKFDYEFKDDVFVGFRGITLSEKDITEEQKKNYATLALRSIDKDVQSSYIEEGVERYIDIDGIIQALDILTEKEKYVLLMKLGLKDGVKHTVQDIRGELKVCRNRVDQIERQAFRKLRVPHRKELMFVDIKELEEEKESIEVEYMDKQAYKTGYEIIKSYITNPDGTAKSSKEIIDIKLSELGVPKEMLSVIQKQGSLTISGLIASYVRTGGIFETYVEDIRNIAIEDLEFSCRVYTVLRRLNVHNVQDLTKHSLNDLKKLRNLGRKSLDEVLDKLKSLGLRLREDEEEDITYGMSEQERQGTHEESKETEVIRELINYCNTSLEAYSARLKEIEDRKEYISEKIRRYRKAYNYYMESEDIFNPNAVVPGVSLQQETEMESTGVFEKVMKRAVYNNVGTNQEVREELHQLAQEPKQTENVKE